MLFSSAFRRTAAQGACVCFRLGLGLGCGLHVCVRAGERAVAGGMGMALARPCAAAVALVV